MIEESNSELLISSDNEQKEAFFCVIIGIAVFRGKCYDYRMHC